CPSSPRRRYRLRSTVRALSLRGISRARSGGRGILRKPLVRASIVGSCLLTSAIFCSSRCLEATPTQAPSRRFCYTTSKNHVLKNTTRVSACAGRTPRHSLMIGLGGFGGWPTVRSAIAFRGSVARLSAVRRRRRGGRFGCPVLVPPQQRVDHVAHAGCAIQAQIDDGIADIGNRIDAPQALDDHVAHHAAGDFIPAHVLQMRLDLI